MTLALEQPTSSGIRAWTRRISSTWTALGNHADEFDVAANADRYAACLKHIAVQINLRDLLAVIPAGQSAQHRQRRISFVPTPQPALGVQMERVGKDQPAIGLLRTDARFQMPVTGAVGLFCLLLREMKRLQLRAG